MDAWKGKYGDADRALKNAQELLTASSATASGTNPAKSKLKRAIRTLDKHLATLRKDLSGIADRRETLGVSAGDLRDASDAMRTFESEVADLKTTSTNGAIASSTAASEREALMAGRSSPGTGYGASTSTGAAVAPSAEEMRQSQALQTRQQDETLVSLEEGLDDLHHLGVGMGQELDRQDVIMDDLSRGIDKADNSLRARSRAIVRILQTNNVCWMYIVIFVLLAALVLNFATAKF